MKNSDSQLRQLIYNNETEDIFDGFADCPTCSKSKHFRDICDCWIINYDKIEKKER